MRIILGSESVDKKRILIKAFSELNIEAEVESIPVESGAEQPMNVEETKTSSVTRALTARAFNPHFDFSFVLKEGYKNMMTIFIW